MENNNQQQEMENLTPEQLAARKDEMKQFFEEAVPFLEAQHKYEKLLAEISEFKYKRFQYDTQYSMQMYQMQHPEEFETEERYPKEQESSEQATKERKLKRG
jgi:threonyl-tRNA synthetase